MGRSPESLKKIGHALTGIGIVVFLAGGIDATATAISEDPYQKALPPITVPQKEWLEAIATQKNPQAHSPNDVTKANEIVGKELDEQMGLRANLYEQRTHRITRDAVAIFAGGSLFLTGSRMSKRTKNW